MKTYWSQALKRRVTIPGREPFKRVEAASYPVSIFIAGGVHEARVICGEFCDEVGLCVTVTATNYIYSRGDTPGVVIGLINYPRFPAEPADIFAKAEQLALLLIERLGQQSASIQAPDKTVWISFREEDGIAVEGGLS